MGRDPTGTGKTTLVEMILPKDRHIIINDSKGEMSGPTGSPGAEVVTSLKAMERSSARVIQVRLPIKEQNEETWNRFYYFVFDRGNTLVVTDELSMVMDHHQPPEAFRACACQGRSRNVSMINCAQRPAMIPTVARSEAWKYIAFELNFRDDRKAMAEFMGDAVVDQPATGHWFWYFDKHERQLHYLKLKLPTQGGT